jgi:hypothetical protein
VNVKYLFLYTKAFLAQSIIWSRVIHQNGKVALANLMNDSYPSKLLSAPQTAKDLFIK